MHINPIDCPQLPKDFYAKLRLRLHHALREEAGHEGHFKKSVCLFKGIPSVPKNYEDVDHLVEQQSTFLYLFGVKKTDCYALIHNHNGQATLFVPRLDENYKLWMAVKSNELIQQETLIEQVCFVDELQSYLSKLSPSCVYLYSGVDSDSKISVALPEIKYYQAFPTNQELLWPLISNLRVIKTKEEIALLRYVCRLTTEAHIVAMKSAKAGLKQMQLHSVFHFYHSVHSGSILMGFDSICSSGQDCATLHYIQNDKILKDGDMVLHDMGGKWEGYVADQAITFPVSGKFTKKQGEIYNAVYFAQEAVLKAMKPGVKWEDMHLLAEEVIIQHLKAIGIINDFPTGELIEKRVGAIFFPHGLGHFFGLRVHDLGGYTKGPPRSDKPGLKSLRTRRTLEQGMCITVEPGVYFIDFVIQKHLKDPEIGKYLNAAKIEDYKEVGGVRLQDNVLVTAEGVEMLSFLPRSIQDLERVLAQK